MKAWKIAATIFLLLFLLSCTTELFEPKEMCGNGAVEGEERCDPPGSDCIIEKFPIFELETGESVKEGEGKFLITLQEIIGDAVLIQVGEEKKLVKENEIKKFGELYVQVYEIKGNLVRFTCGYELGKCTEGCRCVPVTSKIDTRSYCGDKFIDGGEQCDPPGQICRAKSGLNSICNDECRCPEPLIGLTYCGDGIVQRPNTMGLMETCEKPGWQCTLGGQVGICSQNCQCLIGGVVPLGKCGDKNLDLPQEECDPPGIVCVKDGAAGKCNSACKCDLLNLGPKDLMKLKDFKHIICGKEPECWPIGEGCSKDGIAGICSDKCECIIKKEKEEEKIETDEDKIDTEEEKYEKCRKCRTCSLEQAKEIINELMSDLNSIMVTDNEDVKNLIRMMLILLPKTKIMEHQDAIIAMMTETCDLNLEQKNFLEEFKKFIESVIKYIDENVPADSAVETGISESEIESFQNMKMQLEELSTKASQKLTEIEKCNTIICETEKDDEWVKVDCDACKKIEQYIEQEA